MVRLAVVAALIALASVAPAVADELQVQITECDPAGNADQRAACDSRSEDVGPTQRAPREETHTTPVPAPQPSPQPTTETHDYSLRSGKGRRTAGGKREAEQLESLDLGSSSELPPENGHGHDHGGAEFAPNSDLLPTVTTSGGSGFAGFGSNFQFMTSDEALAQFAVPPFLVPIYVAAGRAYGVPWNVLASINKIETDFGRIKSQVSYAGALGWMQFMPATWRAYGVDASGDGVADPSNPVDAIYAAARYLAANGGGTDLRRAIFAYNHADWYVEQVLRTANIYGALPGGLVAETGSLAFGRFPVLGAVSYGDDFRRAQAARSKPDGLLIHASADAKTIATQNVTVRRIFLDRHLAAAFRRQGKLPSRGLRKAPKVDLSEYRRQEELRRNIRQAAALVEALTGVSVSGPLAVAATLTTPRSLASTSASNGLPAGYEQSRHRGIGVLVEDGLGNGYTYSNLRRVQPQIRPGARLHGGQKIGQLPRGKNAALLFSVRAAGGEPVDPRPLVDGYRLQEAADFYHALGPAGGNPFLPDPDTTAPGGVIQGNQAQLAARVLRDSGIQIYPCGRQDIERGIVDKRILAAMLYLRSAGLELTISSLRCGHGFYTAGGNVSAHSFGAAMDIAAFNGQPVVGHQGPGSLTEQAIKLLMKLESSAQPSQLISLMSLGGPSFAMSDHYDHLHVGYTFQQAVGVGRSGSALGSVTFDGKGSDILSGGQVSKDEERQLSRQLSSIANPEVRRKRGQGALNVEAEHRTEKQQANKLAAKERPPFHASTTAAGARIDDIDVPAGGRGDEAYAVGTVAGAGRKGWAKDQTVVLAQRGGVWRIVGAPVDAHGKVRNPRLTALATIAGGRGYAVGRHGSVVLLRGTAAPRIVRTSLKAGLLAVDAGRDGRRLQGVAVGRAGAALALTGAHAAREDVGSGRATLTSVALEAGGGAVAAASSTPGVDPALVYRRGPGGWAPVDGALGLPDAAGVRLTAIAAHAGEVWVAGAVSDARTLGTPAELPLAARLSAAGTWTTYCAGTPALAAIRELGAQSRGCDESLVPPSDARGPAGDVAITRAGVLVSTRGGVHLLRNGEFQPLSSDPGALVSDDGLPATLKLAVARRGTGWAVGGDGRLARIDRVGRSGCGACDTSELPLPKAGSAHLAVAPGRALAVAGGGAATWDGQAWSRARGAGTAVRDVAWSSDQHAWAVAETGALLRFAGGSWSSGEDSFAKTARESLTRALTGRSLIGEQAGRAAAIEALSFRSSDEGYAVGAGGILRFENGDWKSEDSPTREKLVDVASSPEGTVAVGTKGTLLERVKDGWEQSPDALALVAGRDFTAVHAMPDGTVLAVAGGALIQKDRDGKWQRARLAPLGVPVAELAAYRTKGRLIALALVGAGEEKVLLQGTEAGWQAVALPAGARPVDIDLDAESGQLWLAAHRDTGQVAIRLPLGSVRPTARQQQALLGATGNRVEEVGSGLDRLIGASGLALAAKRSP